MSFNKDTCEFGLVQQQVVRPFQRQSGIWCEGLRGFGQGHTGEQRHLRGVAREQAGAKQYGEREIAGRAAPAPPATAAAFGLTMREHGEPVGLAVVSQISAEIGGGWQNLVNLQPPRCGGGGVHPKITFAAARAAASTGAAKRKKPVVNRPPATATKESEAGRASNASAASSKNITLMMRM